MKTQTQTQLEIEMNEIFSVIASKRLVKNRIEILKKMGYHIEERRMGPGGVGQIKKICNETRVQISYGHGRYNYATVVIL